MWGWGWFDMEQLTTRPCAHGDEIKWMGQGLPREAHSLAGGQEIVISAETGVVQHTIRRGKNDRVIGYSYAL